MAGMTVVLVLVLVLALAASASASASAGGTPEEWYDVVMLNKNATQRQRERQMLMLPAPAEGMEYGFYDETCPEVEQTVRSRVRAAVDTDPALAGALLHMLYMDCFANAACDASVLLLPEAEAEAEIVDAAVAVVKVIDDIKTTLDILCPAVVSCADILALAARDAVLAANGPYFPITTGRRDGMEADTSDQVERNMPKPTWQVSQLLKSFKSRGLDVVDLVALSGAHTIGRAHCASFANRLWPFVDPGMRSTMADKLMKLCSSSSSSASHHSNNTTYLDQRTPFIFDNKFYKDLLRREGILTSDQSLFSDFRTKELVRLFEGSKFIFYRQFAASMIRMAHLGVLTGQHGQVRLRCSQRNPPSPSPSPSPSPAPSPSPTPSRSPSPDSAPSYPPQLQPPTPTLPSPSPPPPPAVSAGGGLGSYILFLVCSFGFLVLTSYYFRAKFSGLLHPSLHEAPLLEEAQH